MKHLIKRIIWHIKLFLAYPKSYLYSYTVSTKDIVTIKPHDPEAQNEGRIVTEYISKLCPTLHVTFVGSTGLGLPGKGDIDILAGGDSKDFKVYINELQSLLGDPSKVRSDFIDYRRIYKSYEFELTIMDRNSSNYKRHLKIFKILSIDQNLREKYKQLKLSVNGLSEREYNLRQMDFMNKLSSRNIAL